MRLDDGKITLDELYDVFFDTDVAGDQIDDLAPEELRVAVCNATAFLPIDINTLGYSSASDPDFSPAYTIVWPDCTNIETLQAIPNDDMEDALSLTSAGTKDVVDALKKAAFFLAGMGSSSLLDDKLPGMDQTLGELLDVEKLFDEFVDQVEKLALDSLDDLEEALETALESTVGMQVTQGVDGDAVEITLQGDLQELKLVLNPQWSSATTKSVNLNLSALNIPGLSTLLGTPGKADFDVDLGAELFLDLGLDLSDPDQIQTQVHDTTFAEVTAKITGQDLDFKASVGPLGLFVNGGTLSLTAADGNE